jgi:predicted amidohydrolase
MSTGRSDLVVAAVQFEVGERKHENIAVARDLVARAADQGAELIVLPEKWNGFGTPETLRACSETLDDGESVAALRDWARDHAVHIVGGSITELRPESGALMNTTVVVEPSGGISGVYRKIHLFDLRLDEVVYLESATEAPGGEIVHVDVRGWRIGLSICYDVRFPEMYRILALRGADVLVVPAAFTLETGRDHWEPLLRARAIENQCYVVAAAELGTHPGGKRTYGRSMVVSPWGTIIGQAEDCPSVVAATLSHEAIARIRAALPALSHRRPAAYVWPEEE